MIDDFYKAQLAYDRQRWVVPVSSELQGDALCSITAERQRQDEKWGAVKDGAFDDRPLTQWLAILHEETGELAQIVVDKEIGNKHVPGDVAHLREECVQVAAVAVAMIEQIDRAVAQHKEEEAG